MSQRVQDMWDRGLLHLITKTHPYLRSAALHLQLIECPQVSTLGTDQYFRVYINPELEWAKEEMAWAITHELYHLLFEHFRRADTYGNVDRVIFNIAGDLEINGEKDSGIRGEKGENNGPKLNKEPEVIIQNGKKIEFKIMTPSTFELVEGKLAEEYYEVLLSKAEHRPVYSFTSGGGSGQDSEPTSGSAKDGSSSGSRSASDGDALPVRGLAGDCGSCATGQKAPWELPGPDEGGPEGVNDVTLESIKQQIAQDIKDHKKSRGTVPGMWERFADQQVVSKTPWSSKLRALVVNSVEVIKGHDNPTFRKPSRRQWAFDDVFLPSQESYRVKIAVVIDTSGSMSDTDLSTALSELRRILQETGDMSVPVFTTDASAAKVQETYSGRKIKLLGGGGTDMRVGIAAAQVYKPDIIIVLTDGLTPWPEVPIKEKLVIGIIGEKSKTPSWASTIYID